MPAPIVPLLIIAGVHLSSLALSFRYDRIQREISKYPPVPVQKIYDRYLTMLNFSLSETFETKKFYAYYIYTMILANQTLLNNIKIHFETNQNIEIYKNSFKDWENEYNQIKTDLENTYVRYLAYESIFKSIFGIPYNTRDITLIKSKIPAFDMLTKEQLDNLLTLIINPLFRGYYDFEIESVNVLRCYTIPITNQTECETFKTDFPMPVLSEEDPFKGVPDIIFPWYLYNAAASTKKIAYEFLDSFTGEVDIAISNITGYNQSWTLKKSQNMKNMAESAANWASNTKKDVENMGNDIKKEWGYFQQSVSEGLEDIEKMLMVGAGLVGLYVAYNIVARD